VRMVQNALMMGMTINVNVRSVTMVPSAKMFRPRAPIIRARTVASVSQMAMTIPANVHSCTLETTANTDVPRHVITIMLPTMCPLNVVIAFVLLHVLMVTLQTSPEK
jgi:hypothetical protein